jgi:outer membrane protein W
MACVMTAVHASESFRVGWMPTLTATSINDPNGPTEDNISATLVQGVGIFDMGRDARIFVDTYYDSYEVGATTTNIHNSVTSFGVNASYQWNFRITRSFKPWLGVGVCYSNDTYTDRYTVTPGGLLANAYPERTVDTFSVVLNASMDWRLNRDWNMGLHLQFEQPTGDGPTRARAGMYVVY